MTGDAHETPVDQDTVEAVVRQQLAKALGGRRGMAEAAVPTALFTITWLIGKDMSVALLVSVGSAALLLLVRLVQRSTVQFVVNALVGIGIGWFFVQRSAASGGNAEDQALAYFLPGILVTGVYTIVMATSCLVGWPAFGFLIGSVTGEPTAWHEDRQVVQLCARLTWLFLAPGGVNVLLQGSVFLLGRSGAMDADAAVALSLVLVAVAVFVVGLAQRSRAIP